MRMERQHGKVRVLCSLDPSHHTKLLKDTAVSCNLQQCVKYLRILIAGAAWNAICLIPLCHRSLILRTFIWNIIPLRPVGLLKKICLGLQPKYPTMQIQFITRHSYAVAQNGRCEDGNRWRLKCSNFFSKDVTKLKKKKGGGEIKKIEDIRT